MSTEDPREALKETIRDTERELIRLKREEREERVVTTRLPGWVRLDIAVVATLVISILSLAGVAGLAVKAEEDNATAIQSARVALCAVIDDSYAGALRRKDVLVVAFKLRRLAVELPAGPARSAVWAVEHVFYASGHGNAKARARLNAELMSLGCSTRVR